MCLCRALCCETVRNNHSAHKSTTHSVRLMRTCKSVSCCSSLVSASSAYTWHSCSCRRCAKERSAPSRFYRGDTETCTCGLRR